MHDKLDPELEAPLREFLSYVGGEPINVADISSAREAWEYMVNAARANLPPVEGVDTEDRIVPGPANAPNVRLRIYRPAGCKEMLPAVFWIRGGGFVMGFLEQDERESHKLALAVNCAVVAVEYRWAPENPFPAPVEDCYAGLKWLFNHAAEIGVDNTRIVIAGESGGGGVCASLAYFVRDRAEINILQQMLICPQIDDRSTEPDPSAEQWFVTFQPQSNRFSWRSFLGQEPGSSEIPLYGVPARAPDLKGLAPTSIFVSDLDLFGKESVAYAHRLMEADVPTELHLYPRAYHGFQLFAPEASVSRRYFADREYTLRRAFYG